MNLEIKVIPQENGMFNIILLNTKECIIVTSNNDVPYQLVGDKVQSILKHYF